VTKAEEAAKLAEDQLNLQVGSIEVRDHFVAKLKAEIEAFKKIGITPEKQVLWDRMEEDLYQSRQLATQTGKQLRALTMRVHELTEQVLKEQKLRGDLESKLVTLSGTASSAGAAAAHSTTTTSADII
jgi:TolA-binding protein